MDEVSNPFNARMSKPLVPTVRSIYVDGDTVIIFFDAASSMPPATARDGKPYVNTDTWLLPDQRGEDIQGDGFLRHERLRCFWARVFPAS
jgi:ketosteroid isomerase-like protein